MVHKNFKIGFLILVFVLSLGLIVNSCEKADDSLTTADVGKVTLKITDSPFPLKFVEEANVTITLIEMHSVDSVNGGEWITVWEGSQTINLLELRDGKTEDLPEAEVPAGTYNMILMRIDSVSIKYVNGTEVSLDLPDDARAGIRVMLVPPVEVENGALSEILLDFDVSKSFRMSGKWHRNFPGFMFRPVVRAVWMNKAGAIAGAVSDTSGAALSDVQIQVVRDSVVTHTFTNRMGFYKILGLPEGTYTLKAEKEGYQSEEVNGIQVTRGQVVNQNFTLLPQ
ncbi:DUF4382 domain-containing protein [Caldithrix abyssi]|uniref:Carboxypeptidase regulatory-like domain-containing protein n=1 Tax=Caldithrix abyssi DSM 13497 TaxID=880073 RepID=H1XWI4_CALAY|nr:DUF4382 domain-containing protein [Caldithrix abyssi]APF17743.1 Carboxypeptidase regulatory-like domain-containing protein [Caldithrix abyssi DSM 13497]EHO41822.1 putative lipoprotein [Caldithrix abyssi DSM 13497]